MYHQVRTRLFAFGIIDRRPCVRHRWKKLHTTNCCLGCFVLQIGCTSHNLALVELLALARGTSHMCAQRREKKETYSASDFYYSAVVVLVERGLLHGHIARGYKNAKDRAINGDWVEHSKNLAALVGLCDTSANICAANLQKLNHLMSCTALQSKVDLEIPASICIGASKHLTKHAGCNMASNSSIHLKCGQITPFTGLPCTSIGIVVFHVCGIFALNCPHNHALALFAAQHW
jgi:hypothetical protein